MIRRFPLPRPAAFARAQSGLAAVEFALIAPILILLFVAVVECSNALSVGRRVTLAVNTLADLASQERELTAAQANDLFTGVEQIVAQGPIDIEIRLVSIVLDPDTEKIVVHWSRDNDGGQPYAPGADYERLSDPGLLDANSSLIVGEVAYAYASPLTKRLIPPFTFDRLATRWPRRSARVQFCISSGSCTS